VAGLNRLGDDPQIVDRSRIESGIGIGSVSIDNGSIQLSIQGRCLVSIWNFSSLLLTIFLSYRTTIKMSSFFDVASTIALLDTPESFTACRTKKKGKKSALV
jgi:hypothetical protein